jgi:hypothetical protein
MVAVALVAMARDLACSAPRATFAGRMSTKSRLAYKVGLPNMIITCRALGRRASSMHIWVSTLPIEPCTVMRQQIVHSSIGRCGKLGKYPADIGPRVDGLHLAGSEDAIDDRRAPTGGRMAGKQDIPRCDLRGPKTLDGVLIDIDVPKASVRVAGQKRPSVNGEVIETALRGSRPRCRPMSSPIAWRRSDC